MVVFPPVTDGRDALGARRGAAPLGLDVVGDVHGQREALVALGRRLGYAVDGDWAHPEGRVLLFLGDLVDRGPDSLGVAELVQRLVGERRALCLMGNHEYNLVAWSRGLTGPKRSNRPTIADIQARPARWGPVLSFFAGLPVAVELPGLRLVHAVWHLEHLARVRPILDPGVGRNGAPRTGIDLVEAGVRIASPFLPADDPGQATRGGGLHPALPREEVAPGNDTPFEILVKGFEAPSDEPFYDADGKPRYLVRVAWWHSPGAFIPPDGRLVFGHYWNVPPTPGREQEATPPHPSGHPELARWAAVHAPRVAATGEVALDPATRFVCVDYNGVPRAGAGACVGAYRHPEHRVVWVRDPA